MRQIVSDLPIFHGLGIIVHLTSRLTAFHRMRFQMRGTSCDSRATGIKPPLGGARELHEAAKQRSSSRHDGSTTRKYDWNALLFVPDSACCRLAILPDEALYWIRQAKRGSGGILILGRIGVRPTNSRGIQRGISPWGYSVPNR
jgi:hypothetical protein